MRGNSPPMLSFDGNSLINLFPDGQIEQEAEGIANKNMLGTTVRDLPPVMNSLIYPSICSLTNLDV